MFREEDIGVLREKLLEIQQLRKVINKDKHKLWKREFLKALGIDFELDILNIIEEVNKHGVTDEFYPQDFKLNVPCHSPFAYILGVNLVIKYPNNWYDMITVNSSLEYYYVEMNVAEEDKYSYNNFDITRDELSRAVKTPIIPLKFMNQRHLNDSVEVRRLFDGTGSLFQLKFKAGRRIKLICNAPRQIPKYYAEPDATLNVYRDRPLADHLAPYSDRDDYKKGLDQALNSKGTVSYVKKDILPNDKTGPVPALRGMTIGGVPTTEMLLTTPWDRHPTSPHMIRSVQGIEPDMYEISLCLLEGKSYAIQATATIKHTKVRYISIWFIRYINLVSCMRACVKLDTSYTVVGSQWGGVDMWLAIRDKFLKVYGTILTDAITNLEAITVKLVKEYMKRDYDSKFKIRWLHAPTTNAPRNAIVCFHIKWPIVNYEVLDPSLDNAPIFKIITEAGYPVIAIKKLWPHFRRCLRKLNSVEECFALHKDPFPHFWILDCKPKEESAGLKLISIDKIETPCGKIEDVNGGYLHQHRCCKDLLIINASLDNPYAFKCCHCGRRFQHWLPGYLCCGNDRFKYNEKDQPLSIGYKEPIDDYSEYELDCNLAGVDVVSEMNEVD